MNSIIKTLLLPYEKGLLEWPKRDISLLFFNAESSEILRNFTYFSLIQHRYDKARRLLESGYKITSDPPAQKCGTIWLLPGKDMTETQYFLAQAVQSAAEGGFIVAAAPNDAGGKRLEGLFEDLGLSPQSESKHKARVVFATVGKEWNMKQADIWLKQGQEQTILNSSVLSCPGLHGWDKIDAGSALLARHLPADLSGNIADFGCGWGYLSLQAASISTHINHLTLIDIDSRAVKLAQRNVQNQNPALPVDALWTDLTHPDTRLGPFDAILLNPPFHEGTHAVPALGQAIITTAAKSLKKTGCLYLVANRHLPYEKILQALFARVELLADENGFKALVCRL